MKRIFVSSVIRGFETFRAAAKAGIELMGHRAMLSEEFGARAYSSRQACFTEVEQSDVFLIILGAEFGFETEDGVSVTRAEFRHARASGKPVLAFVQDVDVQGSQADFRREVEDFDSGFFRATFSTPEQLKDEVVRALRQVEEAGHAWPEARFCERVESAMESQARSFGRNDPRLLVAFLPQPEIRVHLPEMESHADELFTQLCNARLSSLRDGYEMDGTTESMRIRSGVTELSIYEDGLRLILLRPQPPARDRSSFDHMFVPPSYVKTQATAAFGLFGANSGWCRVGLGGMQHHAIRELPPPSTTSVSIPMVGEDGAREERLFQPLTRPAYEKWIGQVVERFERRFRA